MDEEYEAFWLSRGKELLQHLPVEGSVVHLQSRSCDTTKENNCKQYLSLPLNNGSATIRTL